MKFNIKEWQDKYLNEAKAPKKITDRNDIAKYFSGEEKKKVLHMWDKWEKEWIVQANNKKHYRVRRKDDNGNISMTFGEMETT